MALDYAHGAVQWLAADAATTTYTVSGLSFQPKALRFWWNGLQSASDALSDAVNLRRGIGFAVSTTERRCVGSFSQDTAAAANCGTVARNDAVACTTDGAGGSDGELDLDAILSDGFRLIVADATPANLTIFWEAWGGSDITVAAVGDIAEPAATGDVDYTVTGFVAGANDQVVMLAGVQSVAAVNTAEANDSGMFVGFASGAGAENVVIIGNSDDASTTMDTDSYGRGDECLGMIVIGGGTGVNARAALTQFGTDNFRLNWAARATTNRRSIFLAIKGGSWHVGDYTIAGNSGGATATVSGLSFAPKGISLIGVMKAEHASNSAGTENRMSLGCGSSTTSRRSMGMLDEAGSADCEIDLILEYDSVLCFTDNGTAVGSAYDINAMNSDGFQIIVDTAGGPATEWQGYLAFGDAAAGGVTANPPGVAATGAAGDVTVSGKANVPLTGVEGAGAAGTMSVGLNTPVALTGAEATGAAGAIGTTGLANVPLTGVEALGQVGSFTILAAANVQLTGVSATGEPGTITVDVGTGEVTALLTGVAATGAAGEIGVSGKASVVLPGVSGVGEAGTPGVSAAVMAALSGVAAIGAAGSLAAFTSVTVTLPGVFADGQAGLFQITGTANVPLTGVEAQCLAGLMTAFVGTLEAPGDRIVRVILAGRTVDVELSSRIVRVTAPSRTIQ